MASFLSRTNTRDDGYGGARENRAPAAARSFCRGSPPRRQEACRRLPVPRRRMHRRRQRRRRRVFISASLSRAPAWISSRLRAAASSTTPSSRRSAPPPIPIPGQAATNACRNLFPTNAGRSAATPSRPRRSAKRCAMPAVTVPVVCTGGIHNFEMAEDYLARGVCDIVGAARQIARRSGLVSQNSAGLRRRGAGVRIHQLLRRAGPEAQARHLPALGQAWLRPERKAHARRQAPPHRASLAAADLNVTIRTDRALALRRGNEPTRIGQFAAGRRCRRTRR